MELDEKQVKWLNKQLVKLRKDVDDSKGFDGFMVYSDFAAARIIAVLGGYNVDRDGRLFTKKTVDGKEVRTYVS